MQISAYYKYFLSWQQQVKNHSHVVISLLLQKYKYTWYSTELKELNSLEYFSVEKLNLNSKEKLENNENVL